MSFIRATEKPIWENGAFNGGVYVYSNGERICHLPQKHRAFVEVVMRMLDQSGDLDDETLNDVHAALRSRLHIEKGSVGWTPAVEESHGEG